jgi:hypothetical protein
MIEGKPRDRGGLIATQLGKKPARAMTCAEPIAPGAGWVPGTWACPKSATHDRVRPVSSLWESGKRKRRRRSHGSLHLVLNAVFLYETI